jgi:hypothetical protein
MYEQNQCSEGQAAKCHAFIIGDMQSSSHLMKQCKDIEKMKRDSPIDDTKSLFASARITRSQTNSIRYEEQRRKQLRLGAERFVMQTDLQALDVVISNGFLLSKECKALVAAQGDDWILQWEEKLAKKLPDFAQVKLKICLNKKYLDVSSHSDLLVLPSWIKRKPELFHEVTTHKFARQIFDRVNDVKVAA